MIANKEFLAQGQVAETVLNLCDDEIAKIVNGKVMPGDRVFYPVKPHIGTTTPGVHQPDFGLERQLCLQLMQQTKQMQNV